MWENDWLWRTVARRELREGKFSECTLVYWYNNDSVCKWISIYTFYELSRARGVFFFAPSCMTSVSALSTRCPDVAREHSLQACCVRQERIVIPREGLRWVHTGFGCVCLSTPQAVRAHSKLLPCHKWALVYTTPPVPLHTTNTTLDV